MRHTLTLVLIIIGSTFLGWAQRLDGDLFAEFMAEAIIGQLAAKDD